jgi:hypothetical protein
MEVKYMKIKKVIRTFFVVILIFIIGSPSVFSQLRKHDLSLSYGVVTLDQMGDIFEDIIDITLTFGLFGKENMEFSGATFLTYHFFPGGNRFGFGPAIGTYTTTGDLVEMGVHEGTFKENNYIFAGEVVYYWILNKSFQMYSVGGIGLRLRRGIYIGLTETDTRNDTFLTFNLQVLGFRFGKKIGVFGEIGAGYKGCVVLGLDAQF